MHNPKHQNQTTMEKSVEQLRKELAEAEAREQGLMNEPYVALCWTYGERPYAFLKRLKDGNYLRASRGAVINNCAFPDLTHSLEYLRAATADEFNAEYDAAMQKIKEAKDE